MFLYLTSGKESFNLSGDVTVSNDLNPDLRFSAIFGSPIFCVIKSVLWQVIFDGGDGPRNVDDRCQQVGQGVADGQ